MQNRAREKTFFVIEKDRQALYVRETKKKQIFLIKKSRGQDLF